MVKKLLITLIFIGFFIISFLQHSLSFDGKIFGNDAFINYFKNNYIAFFYLKDENPTYVWKNDIVDSYSNRCFEKHINCNIFPFQQLYSSFIWLGSIQYLGSVIDPERSTYLYPMLDNLTNLSPYWDYPYAFGELLLPINKLSTKVSQDLKMASWFSSVQIGEKGKKYNCDKNKLAIITGLTNQQFFDHIINLSGSELKNPCDLGDITNYLGFNYFYYLSNFEKSAENYKIGAFNEDNPKSMTSMYAVVTGKGGNHQKSMQIWFSRYVSFLEKLDKKDLDAETRKLFEKQAIDALKKAVYDLQLHFISEADKLVQNDKNCYHNYDCLVKNGVLRNIILENINSCKDFKYDEKAIFEFKAENKEKLYQNIKCLVIGYGLSQNYINKSNLTIEYPFNDDMQGKMGFKWDDEFGSWRVFQLIK